MTEVDLSPRNDDGPVAGSRKRLRNWTIVGSITAVLGFVMFQALTSATVYFYNVDEAVAQQVELADGTFRIQGTVVSEPAADSSGALTFDIAHNEVKASVRHVGEEPTDLFELGIPVVAEGHWDGNAFVSNQLFVKHAESYVADNPDRIDPEIEQRIVDADAP